MMATHRGKKWWHQDILELTENYVGCHYNVTGIGVQKLDDWLAIHILVGLCHVRRQT